MGGRGCEGTRPGGGGEAARLLGSPPTGGGDGAGRGNPGGFPRHVAAAWALLETGVWVVLTLLRVVGGGGMGINS